MPRTPTALPVADVSAFAKALKRHIQTLSQALPTPAALTHAQWLDALAAAAGFRNFATLKASMSGTGQLAPQPPLAEAPAALPPSDQCPTVARPAAEHPLSPIVQKTLQQFDEQGRLVRLHAKYTVQRLACWALWRRFDDEGVWTEREVNQRLNVLHTFGDPATLRRELVNMGLLARKPDCSAYWKCAHVPPDEVRELFAALDQGGRASPKRSPESPARSRAQAMLAAG